MDTLGQVGAGDPLQVLHRVVQRRHHRLAQHPVNQQQHHHGGGQRGHADQAEQGGLIVVVGHNGVAALIGVAGEIREAAVETVTGGEQFLAQVLVLVQFAGLERGVLVAHQAHHRVEAGGQLAGAGLAHLGFRCFVEIIKAVLSALQ